MIKELLISFGMVPVTKKEVTALITVSPIIGQCFFVEKLREIVRARCFEVMHLEQLLLDKIVRSYGSKKQVLLLADRWRDRIF